MSKLDSTQILIVNSKIEAADAARPKGVSPSVLSKLWTVDEQLAEGAIDQNTQIIQCCVYTSTRVIKTLFCMRFRV